MRQILEEEMPKFYKELKVILIKRTWRNLYNRPNSGSMYSFFF